MNLWPLALTIFLLNLPFGYWRANVGRFSLQWFLAIHLPVAVGLALRAWSGSGWQLETLPLLVAAFFAGQLSGAKLHQWRSKGARVPVTSCLVMDLARGLRASKSRAF